MPHNTQRLSEDIKREISASLRELGDERLEGGFASVSRCEVSNELSHCKIYISAHGGAEKTEEIVNVLQGASGFFKKRINGRIKMRKIPELKFIPDNTLDYYDKINGILENTKRGTGGTDSVTSD
ncbi:MAG: 30S ribosome-binding factor RbfA [Oscillospiraceae bacterium]|jgi:ribosome-binding factor A|nr:30S ribosome-binding factor RbfA [Oscillospiraceae bacterium]